MFNMIAHPAFIALTNIKQSIDFLGTLSDVAMPPSLVTKLLDLRAELSKLETTQDEPVD